MATLLSIFMLIFAGYFELSFSTKSKRAELSVGIEWGDGGATWYGSPTGFGSDGGACGYGNAVSHPPFSSLITAIGPRQYQNGKGCGICYKVKCTKHPSCSGKPVTVVVTDLCPGGPCVAESTHFDLSGTAFGALAKPGEEDKLRCAGVLQIQYARAECEYSKKNVNFHIDAGSNPYYLAMVIEFAEGDGDISRVYLKEASSKSDEWVPMQQLWGAVWKLNSPTPLKPPFSILLKSRYSGDIIVAEHVIPNGWNPGSTYASLVNFNPN